MQNATDPRQDRDVEQPLDIVSDAAAAVERCVTTLAGDQERARDAQADVLDARRQLNESLKELFIALAQCGDDQIDLRAVLQAAGLDI